MNGYHDFLWTNLSLGVETDRDQFFKVSRLSLVPRREFFCLGQDFLIETLLGQDFNQDC
jgi:hypothetical protein